MSPSLVTLDYILKNWLLRKRRDLSDYDTYMQILITGLREMNLFHNNFVREVNVRVNNVNQITFPVDLIDWIRIGIYIEGQFFELDYNKDIALETINTSATPVFEENSEPTDYTGYKYTRIRSNGSGQCNIDESRRIVGFKGDFRDTDIVLKYVSTGIPESGQVYVDIDITEVLRTYLDWQVKEDDDMVPIQKAMRAEAIHGDALMRYLDNKNAMTRDEWLAVLRGGIQQGVKR